jgi:hypothetical protein
MRKIALFTLVLLLGGCGGGVEPDGLYIMTRYWPSSGLEIHGYRFADGAVVIDPIGEDLDAERKVHAKDVGTFRREGDDLAMTFDGKEQKAKFEKTDHGCFGWDAGSFCPVKPFASGTKLDGTFTGGASAGGGAVMSAMTITFKPDGTYELSSTGSVSTAVASGGSSSAERGTYTIDGTALTLKPEGGKERVVSTFPYDDGSKGPEPRRMYFGGGMLKRG